MKIQIKSSAIFFIFVLSIFVSAVYSQTDDPMYQPAKQFRQYSAGKIDGVKVYLGTYYYQDIPGEGGFSGTFGIQYTASELILDPGYKAEVCGTFAGTKKYLCIPYFGLNHTVTAPANSETKFQLKVFSDVDRITVSKMRLPDELILWYGLGIHPIAVESLHIFGESYFPNPSGVWIPSGYWVRFCKSETPKAGECQTYTKDESNLKQPIKYIKIGKGTPPDAPPVPDLPDVKKQTKIKVKSNSFVALTDEIPTDAELQILLQKTIQSFADALKSGDFTNFQTGTATDSVLHRITPQRLKEVYGNQQKNVEAMQQTAGKKAVFSRPPFLTEFTAHTQGSNDVRTYSSLNLIGSYDEPADGSGQTLKFNIQYLGERGEWKLLIFNDLQTTINTAKPIKNINNSSPFTYQVPENPIDLINSKEAYEKFAAAVRADLEKLANDSKQKQASALEIEKGLTQLDLQSGDFKSARRHVKKWQGLEKSVLLGPDNGDSYLLEVIINTLEKSKNTTGESYAENFPAELKKVHRKLSYSNQCGLIGKMAFLDMLDKDHTDFKQGLDYSINEHPGSIGNPVNLQTALDILDTRLTALYILPLNPVISDLLK